MADEPLPLAPIKVVAPTAAARLISWVGVYIVTLSFAMFAALMFAPRVADVSEASQTQIITIVQSILVAYVGWQFGAAHAAQRQGDVVAVKPEVPKS